MQLCSDFLNNAWGSWAHFVLTFIVGGLTNSTLHHHCFLHSTTPTTCLLSYFSSGAVEGFIHQSGLSSEQGLVKIRGMTIWVFWAVVSGVFTLSWVKPKSKKY